MSESVERPSQLTTDAMHQLAVRAIVAAYPKWDAMPNDAAPHFTAVHNEVHFAAKTLLMLLERAASHPQTY